MVKNLVGAAVVAADILFGAAAPEVFRNLHKETHAHLYGSVGLYVGLAVLTLWVLASVAKGVSGGEGKPAVPAASSFRQYGGRR